MQDGSQARRRGAPALELQAFLSERGEEGIGGFESQGSRRGPESQGTLVGEDDQGQTGVEERGYEGDAGVNS